MLLRDEGDWEVEATIYKAPPKYNHTPKFRISYTGNQILNSFEQGLYMFGEYYYWQDRKQMKWIALV